MAADVLSGAVHDDRRAHWYRPKQNRRGEGVVDQKRNSMLTGERRDHLDVGHATQRVRDRLYQQQACAVERAPYRVEVGHVDEVALVSRWLEVLADQRQGSAVQLTGGHDRDRLRRE